jgi:hypothetical protein
LHILREAGVSALYIDLVGLPALRLQKEAVCLLIGEANYLVLYRGTVTRPHAFDEPGVQRGAMKISSYYLVRPLVGIDQIAGKLLPPLDWLTLRIDRIRRRRERMLP